MLGLSDYACDEQPPATSGEADYFLLIGLVWTSVKCVYNLTIEIGQMRSGLYSYLTDFYSWLDLLYIFGQATINALF